MVLDNNKMATTGDQEISIWDIPTRVFHWGLVAAIAWSYISIEILDDLQQHFWAGYTVLSLLIFRLFWGLFGPAYARLSRLFFPPKEIINYVQSMFTAQARYYAGHNPLGSLAVLAMLGILLAQVSTGLFASDDYYFGPLAGLVGQAQIDQLTRLHHQNFTLVKIIVALHVVAILLYRLVKKEALTKAMLTGKKAAATLTEPAQSISSHRLVLALILIALSIAIVYLITTQIAEPVPLDDSFYY